VLNPSWDGLRSDKDKIGLGWAKSSWAYIGLRN